MRLLVAARLLVGRTEQRCLTAECLVEKLVELIRSRHREIILDRRAEERAALLVAKLFLLSLLDSGVGYAEVWELMHQLQSFRGIARELASLYENPGERPKKIILGGYISRTMKLYMLSDLLCTVAELESRDMYYRCRPALMSFAEKLRVVAERLGLRARVETWEESPNVKAVVLVIE